MSSGDKARQNVQDADGVVAVKRDEWGYWTVLVARRGDPAGIICVESFAKSASGYDGACQKAKALALALNEIDKKHGKRWVAAAPPLFTTDLS